MLLTILVADLHVTLLGSPLATILNALSFILIHKISAAVSDLNGVLHVLIFLCVSKLLIFSITNLYSWH
jgi:hypothetical protein